MRAQKIIDSRKNNFENHEQKRSGTASYITQGGVKITINKDKKHLNGANLKTTTEENMNLMFYAFNNSNVIQEENTTRNVLRSQTTDRGPSRKLRSRGKLIDYDTIVLAKEKGLASNQIKKRNEMDWKDKKSNMAPFQDIENEFDIPPHLDKVIQEHPQEHQDLDLVEMSPYKMNMKIDGEKQSSSHGKR